MGLKCPNGPRKVLIFPVGPNILTIPQDFAQKGKSTAGKHVDVHNMDTFWPSYTHWLLLSVALGMLYRKKIPQRKRTGKFVFESGIMCQPN